MRFLSRCRNWGECADLVGFQATLFVARRLFLLRFLRFQFFAEQYVLAILGNRCLKTCLSPQVEI